MTHDPTSSKCGLLSNGVTLSNGVVNSNHVDNSNGVCHINGSAQDNGSVHSNGSAHNNEFAESNGVGIGHRNDDSSCGKVIHAGPGFVVRKDEEIVKVSPEDEAQAMLSIKKEVRLICLCNRPVLLTINCIDSKFLQKVGAVSEFYCLNPCQWNAANMQHY